MAIAPARIKAPPAAEFTLTWEGPAAADGEPDDAHFLGNTASEADAVKALLVFVGIAHADWHGGTLAVRDGRGDLVFGVRLPLPVALEVRG